MTDINRIKIYFYSYFKKKFYKFILISRVEKVQILDLEYKKVVFCIWNEKLQIRKYYYSLDKYNIKNLILEDKQL